MSDFDGYLSDQDMQRLRDAAVSAGLATDRILDALLAGLPPLYAGSLPSAPTANARLSVELHHMNRVHNLRNGDVPLAQWLRQAVFLAGDKPETDVFEETLDRVTNLKAQPPASATPATLAPIAVNFDVEPEALVAGTDDTVPIAFLEGALASARSVVKLLVHRHDGGEGAFQEGDEKWLVNGTGWFIGPRLVITNHHVVNARRTAPVPEPDASAEDFALQAEHSSVLFDYLTDDSPSVTVDTRAGALLASDKTLDFAILRLPDDGETRTPLRLRRRVIRKRPEQALGTRVNLLQHPNGRPMRLGFRDNFVIVGDETVLTYVTDTSFGSSGSPVCDDRWSVAALHSGSRSISAQGIEIRGHKVRRENYGIPVAAILEHLETRHPALHQEILDVQEQP
jgi:hypothetical protein